MKLSIHDFVFPLIITAITFYFKFGGLGEGDRLSWVIAQVLIFSFFITISVNFSTNWMIFKIRTFQNEK